MRWSYTIVLARLSAVETESHRGYITRPGGAASGADGRVWAQELGPGAALPTTASTDTLHCEGSERYA